MPDRWTTIRDLFDRALEIAPAERQAFLRRECADDADLFREVLELVESASRDSSLLDGIAFDSVNTLEDLSLEGEVVGNYRIMSRLGIGGMGAVYLAERADGQFEQQVAIKVIKLGMDTEQIIRRFQSERQILARLRHPNIGALLDGGVDGNGRPYFVMEYVDGLPIDVYCNQHKLNIDERLNLFRDVCKAVTYAHSNLIVHRDLKPSNILVTPDGLVKLLDFGIARALTDESPESRLTRTGAAAMTPAYASPEQLLGEPVTTRTDIYSLGVVLYELLAGTRPDKPSVVTKGTDKATLTLSEPIRPSAVLTRKMDAATTAGISEARRTVPDRLRRRLSGDLDVICLSALRPEQERRYQSVDALDADIQRHLAGLPVMAQPDSLVYRMRKFGIRNRNAIAVVLVIAALVGFYTVRLAKERNRVRLESEKAAQVAAFLEDLFDASNPYVALGNEPTVRDLLDAGADRIETELADQPEVKADLLVRLGNIYYNLGYFDKSASLLERALAVVEENYESDSDELILARFKLAASYRRLREFGKADSLLKFADAAVDPGVVIRDAQRRELLVRSVLQSGSVSVERGDLSRADSLMTTALGLLQRGDSDSIRASVLGDLAEVKSRRRMNAAAESLVVEALGIKRRIYPSPHPSITTSLVTLAGMYHRRGDYEKAVETSREVLEQERLLYGPDHPNALTTLHRLSQSYRSAGRPVEAVAMAREAVARRTSVLGPTNIRTRDSRYILAQALIDLGSYSEADSVLQGLLADGPNAAGPPAYVVSSVRGEALLESGRYEAAAAVLRAVQRDRYRRDANIAQGQFLLGRALIGLGRYRAAEDSIRASIATIRSGYPDGRIATLSYTTNSLALAIGMQGRYEEADSLFRQAQELIVELNGPDNLFLATSLIDQAKVLELQGDPEAAEAKRRQALEIRSGRLPAGNPLVEAVRRAMASGAN
ncbi:MAG: tetratricopeptide repeat protein [Bacteroidetes bacterium]|nr:tetratricopeptide repeat protein [Bacteroidota bacterium]